ncbi:3' terminal RNA ribose 2'-O-methyltransferase Hen1 [Deinococcus lacus]|uniref:Small RNA 2'-O-methyltransferase n=1 Tax=Deinococcus lacus TaxID=392561 RepID=A0ABW1YFL9_9DEIO
MLLKLATTHVPATDLGYLLHKHPGRVAERQLSFGRSAVFYPQATAERAEAALLVEVDPVALSRQKSRAATPENRPLEPYVNDRPYASGSFLAAALKDAFGTAMSGRSKERPELAAQPLPLEAEVACLALRGDLERPVRWFGALGYQVVAEPLELDPLYPEWNAAGQHWVRLRLTGTTTLAELLRHLYILLPALDGGRRHFYVGEDEAAKLERYGAGWLETHLERSEIIQQFLRFKDVIDQARERLNLPQATLPLRAHSARLDRVAERLRASGETRILDLGCGEGQLLSRLIPTEQFRVLTGVDIHQRSLELAAERLHLAERPELQVRVQLLQGSLLYPDSRLRDYGAAALAEVIEHLEPHQLPALGAQVWGNLRPRTIIVTTPNAEYNALLGGGLRHPDHRFEWTRQEFRSWAQAQADQYGYAVRFEDVGESHPEHGALTQLAEFTRQADGAGT